ncbi:large ribosomal subunit protein bL20m-like [Diadema antillarum]|uniref:large ribosomal subunit protein bL20m-like n=1 Tax=Diadema antillarum TaxID=105358 RepID=UPI003A8655D7
MVHLTAARLLRNRGPDRYWKRKFILDQSTRYFGRRRNCYSVALRAVRRAWQNATKGRRKKKGDIRRLWNMRIGAAAQEHGIKYGTFVGNLVKYNIQLDRKVLSHLAIYEPKTFQCLAELAKRKHREGILAAFERNPEGIFTRLTTQDDLLEESIRKLRLDSKATSSSPSASS